MARVVRLSGPGGERKVVLDQFFALPSVDATRENVLQPGEIVVEVVVPPPAASAQSAYLEVREKQSFDWPLVSVAAVLEIDPGSKKVHQANVVLGAVAPIPWRSREAEQALAERRARSRTRGERGRRGAQGRASAAP